MSEDPSYELFDEAVHDIEQRWMHVRHAACQVITDTEMLQGIVQRLHEAYHCLIRYHRVVGYPQDIRRVNLWSYRVHHLRFRHHLQCQHCGYWWSVVSSALDYIGTMECMECHARDIHRQKIQVILPVGGYGDTF